MDRGLSWSPEAQDPPQTEQQRVGLEWWWRWECSDTVMMNSREFSRVSAETGTEYHRNPTAVMAPQNSLFTINV